jgi:1-aminocyclopropane-1-carboxylate deaminase/D-cysteine desulfhydrase-like pyridoxal-dependent ACC family enzyme
MQEAHEMKTDGAKAIRALLRPYPTVPLSIKPTPIRVMKRLSARLGPGQRAWIMRDDLTGFALGGNKIRKLEYILGDALAKKVNSLVVAGACSFSRNAAAAGKALGLDVHLLIAGEEADQNPLSREYLTMMGAQVHYAVDNENLQAKQHDLVDALRAGGRNVQELHPGGSDTIGTLAYIEAFAEIIEGMAREGVVFDQVLHASGSAATQAGLVLGQAISRCDRMRIVGIAISKTAEVQAKRVADLAGATAEMLGVDFDPSMVIIDDRYLGDGYPIPSADSRTAVEVFARAEGLLFDPIYVGKAAAALLGRVRGGELGDTANVLLVHTGGNAGAYY